jgi:hypothetical protein
MPVHEGLDFAGRGADILAEEFQVAGVFAEEVFGVVGEAEFFGFAAFLGSRKSAV